MGHVELQPEDIDNSISALQGALKRTWCAFCDASSIHGLKYTKDKETNMYIRFIWILITLIMFLCAIVMVVTFYMEYRSNPTRMNVESEHAPVSNLIFPPTTVCPDIMYNMQKTYELLETLTLPNFTQASDILNILYINFGFIYADVQFNETDINLLEGVLALNNFTILDFVQKISWNCNDLLFRCRFKDEIVPCNELFQISYTFRGYCCSFNLNQSINNFNNRYAHSGLRNGLSLIMYHNDSKFHLPKSISQGFKILIEETNAFPSDLSVVKFVSLKEEVFMTVRPRETFCSQAVKDLSFENRLCVFPHEVKLKFFPLNFGNNCEVNCRIERMLKFCNCYTFLFHSNKTKSERICSYKDIPCLINNYAAIIGRFKQTQCTCYRSCEKIEYDIQVTSAPLQWNIPSIDTFYDDIEGEFSIVHIYLSSSVYRRVRHDLLTNMVTLVSNLGSAFSLFVGMSMISVVEIVYYFSIILNKNYKLECSAREKLRKQKELKTTDADTYEEAEERNRWN